MNTPADWAAIDAAWGMVSADDTAGPRMNYLTSDDAGDYQAKVYKAEMVVRNQKPTIKWQFQVVSGQRKGYLVSHTTWLDADDPKSMARAARDFVAVGHTGKPSSFMQNVSRYVDSIVNIGVRPNAQKPQFPWVDIRELAKEPVKHPVTTPPGMSFTAEPAAQEKFNDDDIPF